VQHVVKRKNELKNEKYVSFELIKFLKYISYVLRKNIFYYLKVWQYTINPEKRIPV